MAERSMNNAMTPTPWPILSNFAIQRPPIVRTVVQGQGSLKVIPSKNNQDPVETHHENLNPGPPPSAPYKKRIVPPSAELSCEICDEPNT